MRSPEPHKSDLDGLVDLEKNLTHIGSVEQQKINGLVIDAKDHHYAAVAVVPPSDFTSLELDAQVVVLTDHNRMAHAVGRGKTTRWRS